jgi:hypothetical protein
LSTAFADGGGKQGRDDDSSQKDSDDQQDDGSGGGGGGAGSEGGSSGSSGSGKGSDNHDDEKSHKPGTGNQSGRTRAKASHNGEYIGLVVGTLQGTGTISVNEDDISFSIPIVSEAGQSGTFSAAKLAINGPYFAGSGTAFGKPVIIRGRLDAAKASRLTAEFQGSAGMNGRIVGTLPGDPGNPAWNR